MTRNNWKNKNVLITGINGFIGGNLSKSLLLKGANVVGLVRNYNKTSFMFYEKLDKKIKIVEGDIVNSALLEGILSENNINFVFHLAAQVEVGVAMNNPFLTYETNVRGTYTLLEACRLYGKNIEAIIVASSDKSYGTYPRDQMPYKEDYPLKPKFPYDTSKACTDLIAKSYSESYKNFPVIITRFCNIYGPGQLNFSAIIPDAIRSAMGHSHFIPRGDGKSIRDFIFVEDVCDLYQLLALKLSENKNYSGEIFNAGTNIPISMKDLIIKIFSIIGSHKQLKKIILEMDNKKSFGEIDCQYMDYVKVDKFFNWQPKTDLSKGLEITINWFQDYLAKN